MIVRAGHASSVTTNQESTAFRAEAEAVVASSGGELPADVFTGPQ
jgi:hypothetical protein